MILVMTGTNPYSFERLVKTSDQYCRDTGCEMFIQLGYTDYIPVSADYERFLNRPQLMEKIRKAELVIVQGGFGSIADCILAGKKVVAVPRMPELEEAPDRQDELVNALEKQGRLTAVYDIQNLREAIHTALEEDGMPVPKKHIPRIIETYIRKSKTI